MLAQDLRVVGVEQPEQQSDVERGVGVGLNRACRAFEELLHRLLLAHHLDYLTVAVPPCP